MCNFITVNNSVLVCSGTKSWYVESESDTSQTDQVNAKQVRLVKSYYNYGYFIIIVTKTWNDQNHLQPPQKIQQPPTTTSKTSTTTCKQSKTI